MRRKAPAKRKTVAKTPARRKRKTVTVPVEKISSWNKYVPPPHDKLVLVYAGEHTAFAIREFNSSVALVRFVSANQLKLEEYAVISGTVKRCDPRYKPDSTYKAPWDDGCDTDIVDGNPEEMCTSSQPITVDEARKLLGG